MLSPLSEGFIKRINVHGRREGGVIKPSDAPSRNAYVNEVAFQLFVVAAHASVPVEEVAEHRVDAICRYVVDHLHFMGSAKRSEFGPLSADELQETQQIGERLLRETKRYGMILPRAKLPGLGRMADCCCDIICDDVLYEIKSGGRNFRSTDLRQLALYSTLNYYGGTHNVRRLCLYNPRQGVRIVVNVNDFCAHFCGLSPAEMFHRISYFLVEADVGSAEL